jgi:nicotinamidase-related amidase
MAGEDSQSALIVVDMLNTYRHPDGERCAKRAPQAIEAIRTAVGEAREAHAQVVFVNDHYDLWASDRGQLIDHVLERVPDRSLVEPLLPRDEDALILKARHSIFYETPLEYFLRQNDIARVTLTGQVTEQCILYSALDAYVRHYDVEVLTDAVIAIDDGLGDAALRMIERNMRGTLRQLM